MELSGKELIVLTPSKTHRRYVCPLCGDTIEVENGVFYGRCPACLMTIIDYKPAPHQENFHKSKAKYRLNIGGLVIENQAHVKTP